MKNRVLISLSILNLFLCLNYSTKINKFPNQDLSFNNGKEHLELDILNEKKLLLLDKTNKVKIKLDNIEPKNVMISGSGISYLTSEYNDEKTITIGINPIKENLSNGKLELIISYYNDKNILITHKFSLKVE